MVYTPAHTMTIGIPKEEHPGETRVALVPAHVPKLTKLGYDVVVEPGAGFASGYTDTAYEEKGARIAASRAELLSAAEMLLTVRAAAATDAWKDLHASGPSAQVVIGQAEPWAPHAAFSALADRGATLVSMELMPRITRAQSMDVLSSMANLAGYKAALLAAEMLPKIFPMLMTAAGTIVPARVLIVGVGVAGLQAIATTKRLGALVSAYDIRPAVKEQVESLGAKFVELDLDTGDAEGSDGYAKEMGEEFYRRQREEMRKVVAEMDCVITTANIPGKKAPTLVTTEMVEAMQPGSVVIDLAAERGGNCELTEAGKTVDRNGVRVHGPVNLPATMAFHASQLYSSNLLNFITAMTKDGNLSLDPQDELVSATTVIRDGKASSPEFAERLGLAAAN